MAVPKQRGYRHVGTSLPLLSLLLRLLFVAVVTVAFCHCTIPSCSRCICIIDCWMSVPPVTRCRHHICCRRCCGPIFAPIPPPPPTIYCLCTAFLVVAPLRGCGREGVGGGARHRLCHHHCVWLIVIYFLIVIPSLLSRRACRPSLVAHLSCWLVVELTPLSLHLMPLSCLANASLVAPLLRRLVVEWPHLTLHRHPSS
jgi:hypothetical protein